VQMDIDPVVLEVRIDTATSAKTGRPYKVLVLKLENGYEAKVFLHPAEVAVIESLMAAKGGK
jgi:hypothetical protein